MNADDDPSNKRVIPKHVAIETCRWAITQMIDSVCGRGETRQLKIPDGYTAEEVAAALGGTVVTEIVRRNGARIVIVRITVGMLVSSIEAQALPPQMFTVEAVAPEVGVARVTAAPVMQPPVVEDYVPIAQAVNETAPIIGDSALIQALSRSAAVFNVIAAAASIILQMRAELRGDHAIEAEERAFKNCCDAATEALDKVWKDVPKKFHDASYHTQTGVTRFYGKRRTRRN